MHDNIKNFRIGDIFKSTTSDQCGWITGLDMNLLRELVFRVRWAKNPDEEVRCHPNLITKISEE